MVRDVNVVIQSFAESQLNMSDPIRNSNWHPAEVQPCITCNRWMHIEVPIHFMGSGYECHQCYRKRTKQTPELKPVTTTSTTEQKYKLCSECGLPDYTYRHEVSNWKFYLIPVKMYLTSDRKLICDRCVRTAELKKWWAAEQAKPRKPYPSYYTKHDPFSKPCTCEFCTNDQYRDRRKSRKETNRNFSNRKRTT
jgi:hypothetical protein